MNYIVINNLDSMCAVAYGAWDWPSRSYSLWVWEAE